MSRRSIPWERVARANTNPLRISILEVLALDGGRTLSPTELSLELQVGLSKLSHHVVVLREQGLIEVAREEQRRGAIEHYYELRRG